MSISKTFSTPHRQAQYFEIGSSRDIAEPRGWFKSLFAIVLAASINFGTWWATHRPAEVPNWDGKIKGFAFSAFQRYQSPFENSFPSEKQLADDIRLLSKYTKRIRTYASAESSAIPRLAQHYGLRVTAGAWLDRRLDNNEVELKALIGLTRAFTNIDRVIIGNETILRQDLTPRQLIPYLDRARKTLDIPISTAEPWHIWLKHPELVKHVDFITVHLLPYWEGTIRREAIDEMLQHIAKLQKAFPGKKIVVGEVGWPSNGDRFRHADPSVENSAQFLRRFFVIAQREKIDYYVMEAFDQPWKEINEGRVGAYWGMFDADREPKFPLTGAVQEDADWIAKALGAIALTLLPMLWFCRRFNGFYLLGLVFMCLMFQLSGSLLVWVIGVPFAFYLDALDWAMLAILLPAQLAIMGILLTHAFEFAEVAWHSRWQRFAGLLDEPERAEWPFVSIHLACANEPPEMVIATLDSLAALQYERFEVVIVDNNTEKDEIWQPVQAHCQKLGPRFRFFHLNPWPGFKAGALNFALGQTDARAQIIGVVDADYVVDPGWLKKLVGHFDDDRVAIVQAPQAHRDFSGNLFRRMCNWEYEGFFRIGMHHRNERNAIIQHGTMTLIRKGPLAETGQWAEWCICEDAELGLRLFNAGYQANYVDEVLGRGLTPADFRAYKSQRFRWAFGAMQILRRRWRWLIGPGKLDAGQRFHFLTGWFSWFADALHLVFTLLAMGWTLGMIYWPERFSLPLDLFLIPVIGFFACKAFFGITLYRIRVRCGWAETLHAAIASMALSHAIARGILKGLVSSKHPFTRTAKSRRLRKQPNAFTAVREETAMFFALTALAIAFARSFGAGGLEENLWIGILLAQSLPYFCAMICAAAGSLTKEKAG